jgi:hypothetical protein
MQGARIFWNEAYLQVRRKDEAQHSRWTFYEAVNFGYSDFGHI